MFLNEGTLLNNLRIRYKKDKIYVSNSPLSYDVNISMSTMKMGIYMGQA